MACSKPRIIVRTLWTTLTLLTAIGAPIAEAGIIVLPSATISLRAAAWPDPCTASCTPEIYNGPFQAASQFVSASYPSDSSGAYPAGNATATTYSGLPRATAETLGHSEAGAILLYDFYILGAPNTVVPIAIVGSFAGEECWQTCGGPGVIITDLVTSDTLISLSPFTILGYPANPFRGGGSAIVSFDATADAMSDVIYQVELLASTSSADIGNISGNPNLGPASYYDVDSTISVSSTFQNANEYQLIFSPGIGGSLNTSVPETSSFFLFAAGLLVFGIVQVAATRQRKISV